MYRCTFIKYLWKDDDQKRLFKKLEKEISLPFAPSIGLEIIDGEWFSGIIERIVWNNSDESFSIKVADIVPKEGLSAELLLDVAIKQGWQDPD